jgi:hypothetical protein
MRVARPALAVSISFFLSLSLAGQQTATTVRRDPQALTILQGSIGAMGGAAPSDSTAFGTVTATAGTQTQSGPIQILTLGTNQSVETTSLPNLSQSTIFSNWTAAQTNGSSAQQQLSDQLAVTSQTALYPLPILLGMLNNPDVSLLYIGQETVAGVTANHIRIWNTFASRPYMQGTSSLSTRDVWLDSSTSLPIRISFTQQAATGQAFKTLVQLDFSNYQQASGFAYPHTIEKSLNGTPWLTISIQNVAFNTGLQASQFQLDCNTN